MYGCDGLLSSSKHLPSSVPVPYLEESDVPSIYELLTIVVISFDEVNLHG